MKKDIIIEAKWEARVLSTITGEQLFNEEFLETQDEEIWLNLFNYAMTVNDSIIVKLVETDELDETVVLVINGEGRIDEFSRWDLEHEDIIIGLDYDWKEVSNG